MKVEPKVPMETQKTNGRREEEKRESSGLWWEMCSQCIAYLGENVLM